MRVQGFSLENNSTSKQPRRTHVGGGIYAYIYIYMYTHTYIYTHIYIYTYMRIYVYNSNITSSSGSPQPLHRGFQFTYMSLSPYILMRLLGRSLLPDKDFLCVCAVHHICLQQSPCVAMAVSIHARIWVQYTQEHSAKEDITLFRIAKSRSTSAKEPYTHLLLCVYIYRAIHMGAMYRRG